MWSPQDLDAIPRLGWIVEPTPVTPLGDVAAELGLDWLGVKRDDLADALYGGTKARKLDYLLAAAPYADAAVWAGAGGIGSGNVVALTAAAEKLGRRVEAHLFWTPVSPGVLENLAFTASGPAEIHFHASRLALALRRPAVLFGERAGGVPVVPPGATSPAGLVGVVRAALELAAQIRAGALPAPSRVYAPLGTGGVAAGLGVGLALGGVRATVVAVAVVERLLVSRRRVAALQRALAALLERAGIAPVPPPAAVEIVHGHVGGGYGATTPAALAACEALAAHGITLEPVYTGKAMAALLEDARRGRGGPALFWQTARRGGLPHDPRWRERLPPALARRLAAQGGPARGRRRVVVALGAAVIGAAIGVRVTGYPPIPGGWRGAVLGAWEAHVVRAAAEALLPPEATEEELAAVPARVDRYLVGMPPGTLREVHGMLALVEHGTTPLARRWSRFTRIPPADRAAYLEDLAGRSGILGQAYRGLRDLCLLGYYQQPSTWAALGYDGPRVPLAYDPQGADRMAWPAYDALEAGETLPRSAAR